MVDEVAQVIAEEEAEQSYDTSDPKSVNDARKRAGNNRKARLDFIVASMGLVQGRAWFYDVLVDCHIFENPFIQGSPDGTAFRLGEQNIGRQILGDIQTAAPEQYLTMIKENK